MPRITDFQLLDRQDQPVLKISRTIPLVEMPQFIGESFRKIGAYLQELGVKPADLPYAAFSGDMSNPEQIQVEIGFPTTESFTSKDDIEADTLEKSRLAFCMYQGDNALMEPVYQEMFAWIKDQGYQASDKMFECYYNGPEFGTDKLLTRITIPVKKA